MSDASKCKCNGNYTVNICLMLIIWLVINTVFVRFVHYDSQYRYLDPAHYNINVVTQADYDLLADPEKKTVKLSGGRTVTKSENWRGDMVAHYKPVGDGEQYAAVTLRGTAAFVQLWYSFALPVLCICVVWLIFAVRYNRRQKQEALIRAEER